jgi:tetratricopeptide (TPR) repeat protein
MEQHTQDRSGASGPSALAGSHHGLELPEAPASESGPVKAWEKPVVMRTYLPADPDRNPLFLEKRVYQGSSGRVYPLPVIDRIATEACDHSWQAVHLENEFLRIMILPEIGGRIHVGLDKLNQYDFFYRQNVIKPALVGLAGPWVSGGVEFNWPQHHRPATFMPTEVCIEREADGSVIVWCGDYDPMTRLKGMHGICLHPHQAIVELRVRLYNNTPDTHTFLWWANAATHVHESYQSFFPKDARFVADHARRAITEFPLCQGTYYGVNYGERARCGVPGNEKPSLFVPDGSYPFNDLSWYANIPVPTSYMIVGSRGDFAGGYDHRRNAGLVQFSNHHIAPGKKQWTWGNHEFGYAWDRSLTDSDGPYIELMTGVYTDNQPDFSFLAPGETRAFRQWWYPIRAIGVPDAATLDAALRVEFTSGRISVHLLVTSARPGSTVRLLVDGNERDSWRGDLLPEAPLHHSFPATVPDTGCEVLLEHRGRVLLRYAPSEIVPADLPVQATEPASPAETKSSDELYLIGLHLEQYRHPTRSPESYWREALRRDPEDSRANHALGRWHLRRGELAAAEKHLRIAIARLTQQNPNPADGEPFYNLGRALAYQQRFDEAYASFYKSTWNAAWRGPGYHRLAEIDCRRGDWVTALNHLDDSLHTGIENLNARNLKTLVLLRLGRTAEAESLLRATRALDPLDLVSRWLQSGVAPRDGQHRLDLAFFLVQAGMLDDALRVAAPAPPNRDGSTPMLLYLRAQVLDQLRREQESVRVRREAAIADPAYVFPSRIEEMLLLEEAIRKNPQDARAPYYLGNLLYDRRRHREGIAQWERSTALDPGFPTAWRNLGFGYFNILHDPARAREAFARARQLSPADARIFYEQDQLAKRTGESPESRLAAYEANRPLVDQRDDLSVELATLFNNTGQPESALSALQARRFQPWEGGEGQVLAQFVRANILLAESALKRGDADAALALLQAARHPPQSLGEAHHLLVNLSAVDYWLGVAHERRGNADEAAQWFERAARAQGDFQRMQVQPISESTCWSALALRRLGREQEAVQLFRRIQEFAAHLRQQTPVIDYFATSLPAMLLFDEDLRERQEIYVGFLEAQALLGLGATAEALERLRQVVSMDRNHPGALDLLRAQAA